MTLKIKLKFPFYNNWGIFLSKLLVSATILQHQICHVLLKVPKACTFTSSLLFQITAAGNWKQRRKALSWEPFSFLWLTLTHLLELVSNPMRNMTSQSVSMFDLSHWYSYHLSYYWFPLWRYLLFPATFICYLLHATLLFVIFCFYNCLLLWRSLKSQHSPIYH